MTTGSTSPSDSTRTVLITGGTKNIGLATAEAFARSGYNVIITGRNQERLANAHQQIEALASGRVVSISSDATDFAAIDQLATDVVEQFGRIDVLVNNALSTQPTQKPIVEVEPDEWTEGFTAYVAAPIRLIRALVPSMRTGESPAIVNLVSTAGFTAVPGLGAYGVAKAAMWAMTQYLASELAPEIRVNAVCPGTTTEGREERLGSEVWKTLLPRVPLARMGGPEECAEAVLYLADKASYTCGQVIFVEGGRVTLAGAR